MLKELTRIGQEVAHNLKSTSQYVNTKIQMICWVDQ